jgi:hypothetical protein
VVAAAAKEKAAAATTVIGTKPHGRRKNSAQNATRRSSTIPRIVSPSRQTKPNAPRDGAPNARTDRDWGPQITMQHYKIGSVKKTTNFINTHSGAQLLDPTG